MPISVQCSCGKRMGVSDALAGKTIKCSACGDPLMVTPAAAPAGARKPVKKEKASPTVYISTGKIVGLATLGLLVVLGVMFYFGPVRVWHQWEDVGPKAQSDVADVLPFALQAYLSEQGAYDPGKDAHGPSVDADDVHFFRPTLVMSMPESVTFFGKSNQGDFKGHYHPATGEIDADLTYGGMTFGGAVTLVKATSQIHITGRMSNGQPQAELNGTPLKIVYPPKDDSAGN